MQYCCEFGRGKWNPDDWIMVKSPDFALAGEWVQHDDQITNRVPDGATPEEMLSPRAAETFAGMLLKNKHSGPLTVEAVMEFDHRMCPLLVFAGELIETDLGVPEYRQDTQVVLYDEGSIVWSRCAQLSGTKIVKLAWLGLDLKPHEKHCLRVEVRDKQAVVTVNSHTYGCTNENMPDEFYVGIAGCEGINHFYTFALHTEE